MTKEVQPEGNYYDKYHTKNPIEQYLMRHFFDTVQEIISSINCRGGKVLEAGCGEGHFTAFLSEFLGNGCHIDAFDLGESAVEKAKKWKRGGENIDIFCASIYEIPKENGEYRLVVASEVLEHLEEPERALRELLRVSSKYVFITVPNEPIWRILNMARGKYLHRFGNTPGHIQHWSQGSFLKMLEKVENASVVKVRRSLPWLLVLIEKSV